MFSYKEYNKLFQCDEYWVTPTATDVGRVTEDVYLTWPKTQNQQKEKDKLDKVI